MLGIEGSLETFSGDTFVIIRYWGLEELLS